MSPPPRRPACDRDLRKTPNNASGPRPFGRGPLSYVRSWVLDGLYFLSGFVDMIFMAF